MKKNNDNKILENIRDFIGNNYAKARQSSVSDDMDLFKGQIVDSMGLLLIINFLESDFDIIVSDEDVVEENFSTINAIYRFLKKKIDS